MPKIFEITDINADELKYYTSLTAAELRRNEDVFIAESVKVIKSALNCGLKPLSFLMEKRQIEGIGKELIELCGESEYFHLGCDEAYGVKAEKEFHKDI